MGLAQFEQAFVLHYRAYRDTSLLLELLTAEQGRVAVIAKGAKRAKSSWKGLLQPFVPIQVCYQGKRELKTLCQAESNGKPLRLVATRVWCGLYLNELLVNLLHGHEPCPNIFSLYHQTLLDLHTTVPEEILLRQFEKQLLRILGYELHIHREANTGDLISDDCHYHYLPEHGLTLANPKVATHGSNLFSGKVILAIQQNEWQDAETLRATKRLLRLAFSPLLRRPLNSPKIFSGSHPVATLSHSLPSYRCEQRSRA